MKLFLQNTSTRKRYEILGVDKETGKVTLKGPHATFEENYDVVRFKEMGYKLVKEPTPAQDA